MGFFKLWTVKGGSLHNMKVPSIVKIGTSCINEFLVHFIVISVCQKVEPNL